MAHYVLNHSVVREHKIKNRKTRNKIISTLIGVVVAFGEAGLTMRGAELDDEFSEFYSSLYSSFQKKAVLYGYETSREQELEADIVSFRYLEAIGMDPNAMTKALIKLRDICGDTYAMQTSTHPTLSYRINLLQFLWYIDRKGISLKHLLEE
jgi:predicted Zn-dependent protease